jgi:hypothetical protein
MIKTLPPFPLPDGIPYFPKPLKEPSISLLRPFLIPKHPLLTPSPTRKQNTPSQLASLPICVFNSLAQFSLPLTMLGLKPMSSARPQVARSKGLETWLWVPQLMVMLVSSPKGAAADSEHAAPRGVFPEQGLRHPGGVGDE